MSEAKTLSRASLGRSVAEMDPLTDFQRVEEPMFEGPASLESVRSEAAAAWERAQEPLVIERPGLIARATAVWMSLTFALCYVLLPIGREAMGLRHASSVAWWEDLGLLGAEVGAFAMALAITVGGIAMARPRVVVDSAHRDPALAATAGGLATWALLHNSLLFLVPFGEMSAPVLASFIAVNVLESALFGVMLASFVRSPGKAFALGAVFQVLFMGLSYMLMLGALIF